MCDIPNLKFSLIYRRMKLKECGIEKMKGTIAFSHLKNSSKVEGKEEAS